MAVPKEHNTELENAKGYSEEDEKEAFTLLSGWQVFEDFKVKIGHHYQFLPTIGGNFSGFDVYYSENKLAISGINTPTGWKYWKKLDASDAGQFSIFTHRVIEALMRCVQDNESEGKAYKNKVNMLFNAFVGRVGDNRSEIAMQAYIRSKVDNTFRTISGIPGCHKIVPLVEWFSTELQSLDAKSMLTIFPEAEAEVLMLVLGKALVGYSGCNTAEGILDHKARSYAIMVDQKGGLGKSTLMQYVRSTMAKLGYSVTSVNMNMSKFGWGQTAQSDLALIDDLENKKLGQLISSFQIKSLVTNGQLMVEEKGMPAQEVQSLTTVLGASNTTDPRHFFEMDGGSMSRLNQLQTLSIDELTDRYGQYQEGGIYEQWNKLCDTYNCDLDTLTAYFLARCAEMFLVAIDVKVVNGMLVKGDDQLQDRMEALRDKLRISPVLTYTDDLLKGMGNFLVWVLACTSKVNKDNVKDIFRSLQLSPDMLLAYIKLSELKTIPFYSDLYPDSLNLRSLEYANKKATQMSGMGNLKSYADCFGVIIGELTSSQGFPFPKGMSFYAPRWDRALDGCLNNYDKYKEVVNADEDLKDSTRLTVKDFLKTT